MPVCVGTRVSVPFRNYTKEGYILELTDEPGYDPAKIKDIIAPLENYPALLPEMIRLAFSMKDKYHCTLCEALRLMLPSEMRGNRIKVKTELCAELLISANEALALAEKEKRSKRKRLFLNLLSDKKIHPISELKAVVSDPLPLAHEYADLNIVRLFEREVLRKPAYIRENEAKAHVLTVEQQEVMDELLPALHSHTSHAFLLHGVTGSGKTEVYMRLVQHVLDENGTAIILVPEIVLTPQMIDWFKSRFGECSAVLHSKLSAGERFDEWRRIRRGDARIVIGARSAVFAPLENLRLIVVDEEHEQTYISEHFPQYDAREIAHMRTQEANGVLLLASATPSILSYAMTKRGDYTLLEMPHRANGKGMPDVTIVDMREELRLGNKSMFSALLLKKMKSCIAAGDQMILFLNRRGYAPTVKCRSCGYTIKCSQCDVSMTYHSTDNAMHCHYCGQSFPMPETCPECGSSYIRQLGIGTQKVEDELKKLFPDAGILRMDVDTTTGKNAYIDILNAFRSGQARILIGTQMIAKGLDFPRVTLVGAILADMTLELPDWRSPERTYQLLVQVAGRAGRADKNGEVIIQTYKPEHYAISSAVHQDYRQFFNDEFERRKRDLYPPFTRMIRLLCESNLQKEAITTALSFQDEINHFVDQNPLLKKRLLYMHCDRSPIGKIQNVYRAQVLMKVLNHKDTERLLEFCRSLSPSTNTCKVYFEIDPASLA